MPEIKVGFAENPDEGVEARKVMAHECNYVEDHTRSNCRLEEKQEQAENIHDVRPGEERECAVERRRMIMGAVRCVKSSG